MTALTLSARTYRHVDVATKLLGVGLLALGLELGGSSPTGIALGVAGAAFALTTVFLGREVEA
ncbi:MAG: hypothetical protein V5A62_17125 [Haloarculaceae archaeon]